MLYACYGFVIMMDLHIITWNINGLHNSRQSGARKLLLRQDLHRYVVGEIDVLFVQEHKLSLADTQSCGQLLPGHSRTFWEPATGVMSRNGGVAISVGPRWLSCVRDHGTLVAGRCIWVSMQIDDHLLDLLCVYAPTEARLRAVFWQEIVDVLPPMDSWIVGGDFNNLESPLDYRADIPPHLPEIAPVEIDAWDSFLFFLRVTDAWHEQSFMHSDGSLHFSWGFRRQAGRLLERLDRFYIGDWASSIGGSMMIWPGTALSDHAPVSIRLIAQRPIAPRRGCRIPDAVLSSATLHSELQHIWRISSHSPP